MHCSDFLCPWGSCFEQWSGRTLFLKASGDFKTDLLLAVAILLELICALNFCYHVHIFWSFKAVKEICMKWHWGKLSIKAPAVKILFLVKVQIEKKTVMKKDFWNFSNFFSFFFHCYKVKLLKQLIIFVGKNVIFIAVSYRNVLFLCDIQLGPQKKKSCCLLASKSAFKVSMAYGMAVFQMSSRGSVSDMSLRKRFCGKPRAILREYVTSLASIHFTVL